jgi:hypothetical protein
MDLGAKGEEDLDAVGIRSVEDQIYIRCAFMIILCTQESFR